MRRLMMLGILTAVLVLSTSLGGYAALVYSNGTPKHAFDGYEATQGIETADFTLFSTTRLTSVRFWDVEIIIPRSPGSGYTGYSGSLTWFLYANNAKASEPGALLYTGHTSAVTHQATGRTFKTGDRTVYEFRNDFSIGPVSLGSGTYWLGLHNGPLSYNDFVQFYWETTNRKNATNVVFNDLRNPGGLKWNHDADEDVAFQLYGKAAVPEPSSLLVLGSGMMGTLYCLRRRRRA